MSHAMAQDLQQIYMFVFFIFIEVISFQIPVEKNTYILLLSKSIIFNRMLIVKKKSNYVWFAKKKKKFKFTFFFPTHNIQIRQLTISRKLHMN